jgi:His/Glu/Gln/Arg/opine family amino acid ABC transporter permease subunit
LTEFLPYALALWNGFTVTFLVSIAAITGSLIVGTLVAIVITSGSGTLATIARTYVELFRNIPFLVLIFFFYFGLPELGIFINSFWTGAMALSLAVGAYVADAVRGGIASIDRGVHQAAVTYGLSRLQRLQYITLPLAFRVALRPLGSIFINLILTTSLLSTITLGELTNAAKIIASTTFRPFEVYFILLVLYSVLTYSCSLIVQAYHHRLTRHL